MSGPPLLLTSSLLTDRMLAYSTFPSAMVDTPVDVWAASMTTDHGRKAWAQTGLSVAPMPAVRPFRERPFNYLRRVNEAAWDEALRPPSRESMALHGGPAEPTLQSRGLRLAGRAIGMVGGASAFETGLNRLLGIYERSVEATSALRRSRPSFVMTTNPFWFVEPGVVASAQRLGIPTVAMIPSWDNVTTKKRMSFVYDGYVVWSERGKAELHDFYPASRNKPVEVIGAPQFDAFFDARFEQSRVEFCASHGLDARLPIIVYALGSPNFLHEWHGAQRFVTDVARGELGDVQVLVRPHPIHDRAELDRLFEGFGPRVVVQRTGDERVTVVERTQNTDDVLDWVNTFRHADVVINLASTVTIDAAMFDRPVVSLDFDAAPNRPQAALIHDLNRVWSHWAPVAGSGGVWLVRGPEEVNHAVRTYLEHPDLHREGRARILTDVCTYTDGRSGRRLAEAIESFGRHFAGSGRARVDG